LNELNIPFVNHVKYLSVIFDKRITWRLHREIIEAKAFRTFTRIYSLFKSERLNVSVKLTLHKALIRLVVTYAYSAWERAADNYLLKLQCLLKLFSAPLEIFQGAHWSAFCTQFLPSVCIQLYNNIVLETSRSHTKSWEWHILSIGQGVARHRKYKRFKLGLRPFKWLGCRCSKRYVR
jgi:hypothetical protein